MAYAVTDITAPPFIFAVTHTATAVHVVAELGYDRHKAHLPFCAAKLHVTNPPPPVIVDPAGIVATDVTV